MLNSFIMRYFQFQEEYKEHGIRATLEKFICRTTEFILVVKDLSNLKPAKDDLSIYGMRFMEISSDNLKTTALNYPVKSRYYKLSKYTKKGYKIFAILKGNELIADVCYITAKMSKLSPIEDLKWFKMQLKENETYMFDMFVKTGQRGSNVTNSLVNHALNALKEKAKLKVYGYYDSDNIPALWFHRMHGYKELEKIKTQQFFVFKRVS